MPALRVKRGTRAQLAAAAAANQLAAGEPYLITDESRIAIGTGVSGFEATAKQSEVQSYPWQMVLSGPTAGISAGSRGGAYAGVAGTVTAIEVVCDPNGKPTGSNVIINLQKVDLATGAAADLCSPDSTIVVGSATGAGTVVSAAAAVTATTWLEAVCVQGDAGVKSISILATIQRL